MPFCYDINKEKVMQAITEHFFQTHKFPSIKQIAKNSDLSVNKCRKICDFLARQNQLYIVFDGKGLSTVYITYDMMQSLLKFQKKPDWLSNYIFKDEQILHEELSKLNNQLSVYDKFKMLLYSTDILLEEAVAFTFEWLDFSNINHYKDKPDNPDITFEYNGIKAIVEVVGTNKSADKDKATQLGSWIQRELNAGKRVEDIQGILVVNHYKEKEPQSRGPPLTPHAIEFLKLYKCKFFTTTFLFNIVKQVIEGTSTKEDARNKVWQGEPFVK
ncbi:MAG: hypothetical protein QXY76_06870 [Nitrososphaeria archaeon]